MKRRTTVRLHLRKLKRGPSIVRRHPRLVRAKMAKVPIKDAKFVLISLNPDWSETATGYETKKEANEAKEHFIKNKLVRDVWVDKK